MWPCSRYRISGPCESCETKAKRQIENEHGWQWENQEKRIVHKPVANYMQLLQDAARDAGIDVPVFHNAPNTASITRHGATWSGY